MSTLAVTVNVAGAAGTALVVQAYPQTDFSLHPSRGFGPPNAAATATGTTDGSGNVTLTGLSTVAYELLVVDARGVNNWFFVPASYIGLSFTATIPWTTPTSVTEPVSTGGDTPGGPFVSAPWAQQGHFHEVTVSGGTGKHFVEASNLSSQTIGRGITGMSGMTQSRVGGTHCSFNATAQQFAWDTDGVYGFSWWTHFATVASFNGAESILYIDGNPTGGGDQTYNVVGLLTGSGLDFMWQDTVIWSGGSGILAPEVLVRGAGYGGALSLDQVVMSLTKLV